MRKPKYTQSFQDRHGKWRCYFRKRGCKPVPLPGVPWTPTFMAAYEAALNGVQQAPQRRQHGEGTVAVIAAHYYATGFQTLRKSTQAAYRGIIDKIVTTHGHRDIALLTADDIERMLYGKAKTPHAANRWLKIMRMLSATAIKMRLRADNPTAGIKFLPVDGDGHAAWTEGLVGAYRATHASGAKARLAFELLVGTMQRRGDVVKLGRQHMRDGALSFRQSKTGMLVEIPVLPELQVELAALPAGQMTFLMTEQGKPFTAAGFGNWFRDRCNEASVPVGYSAHGLRKLGAVRLAERGRSTQEIMAWGGWKTLSEVERYTASASRKKLALSAVAKMEPK